MCNVFSTHFSQIVTYLPGGDCPPDLVVSSSGHDEDGCGLRRFPPHKPCRTVQYLLKEYRSLCQRNTLYGVTLHTDTALEINPFVLRTLEAIGKPSGDQKQPQATLKLVFSGKKDHRVAVTFENVTFQQVTLISKSCNLAFLECDFVDAGVNTSDADFLNISRSRW